MEIIKDFFNSIDWSTIIVFGFLIWGAIKFFSKSFISSFGEKTAELLTIKQKTLIEETVRNECNKALEEFKSDLEKKNIAFKIDYTFFNTERSKVCIDLYKKLIDLHLSAHKYVCGRGTGPSNSFFEGQEEEYDKLEDDILNYIDYNRALIPDSICNKVEDFINHIRAYFYSIRFNDYKKKDKDELRRDLDDSNKKLTAIQEEIKDFADSVRHLIQPQESTATLGN